MAASYSVVFNAPLSSVSGTVAAGAVLIKAGTAYVVATTANRTTYGRAHGVALTAGDGSTPGANAVDLQEAGVVPSTITGLGSGTASWVRVTASGGMERCTPAAGDDLLGRCDTAGDLFLQPGVWDSTNYAPGGGDEFSTPTGTGPVKVTSGALDAAASPIDLSDDTNEVTGTLALSHVASPTGTGFATVTSGAWDAAALAYPLGVAKGGTGATTFSAGVVKSTGGTTALAASAIVNADVDAAAAIAVSKLASAPANGQVLTTVAGVAAWADAPAGATSDGDAGTVQTSDGAGGLTGATNVVAGSGFLAIGASPAASGGLRLPNAVAISARYASNTGDQQIVQLTSGNVISYGDFTNGSHTFNLQSASNFIVTTSGTELLRIDATNGVQPGKPIIGDGAQNSPYGVHGKVKITLTGDHTLSASEYKYNSFEFTGSLASNPPVTVPAGGATDAGGYRFCAYANWTNTSTATTVTLTTGAGNSASLSLSIGQDRGIFEVNADGVFLVAQ